MQAAHGIEFAEYAIDIRPAHADDLAALNGVVERAFMTWPLPDRVKRLSLPSYRYHKHDLQHLQVVVAQDGRRNIVGVAAWEAANPRDLPSGQRGLLLHGLYVDPPHMHHGIGSRLLDAALAAARQQAYDGLLVKAKAEAGGFFAGRGMTLLPVVDPERDYPHRYWQPTGP
ncbi:MAG: GNAT family N-acetyltransferase [Thiobacillus sp.]